VLSQTRRLIVVNMAWQACPLADAFQTFFQDAAGQHPDAIFARLALSEAADEAAGELLQALHVGTLPCTMLLWGKQLLSQLEVAAAYGATPEAAAAGAASDLQAALLAAGVQTRLQHADMAVPAAAPAQECCLVFA